MPAFENLQYDPLTLLAVTVLGWLMGSFNTAFCYRVPREIPLGLTSNQRSKCPACDKVIPWHNNIPIFSYLLLKGKCSQCSAKIPLRYFFIEVSTLIAFVATYFIYANSINRPVGQAEDWAELVKVLYFSFSLVATVFIDIEFRIIPDRFSIGNWVIALAAAALWSSPDITSSLAGCALGFGMFFLMAWGYEKLKGVEGLGFGDVKMMGWLGAWLGATGVPFTILVASITGLVAGLIAMRASKEGFKTAIPFGPFLAIGAYLTWALQSLGLF